ncbi:conserved Plasmodium protein, unknown function [Plasmodium malariae]|uniref:Uncharacterized protein n=1 Tax=Plasmodium malariae TaxID=5858 RepID=A0A1D3RIY9_PLAMA|nr:conserved Plasmodium protein, unknown function [Plasmodium malariae]SCN45115.1 conserved Plasmodium protein, unknown function [Plasmodium malariae]
MKKQLMFTYAVTLCCVLRWLNQANVACAINNEVSLDDLDGNTLLAFFLLVQLNIPYFLKGFSQKIIYEKLLDGLIHLFNEEIGKNKIIKEQKGFDLQDVRSTVVGLGNILTDIRRKEIKYFTWIDLIFKECWNEQNNCAALTTRRCALSSLSMLPKKVLPITCTTCILYALNYALHSKYLFNSINREQVCNDENNKKLVAISTDISYVREYSVYLNSLSTISALKNIQSEIFVFHIKSAKVLINLLKQNNLEAFTRIVNNSLSEVIKKSADLYIKYSQSNNFFLPNGSSGSSGSISNSSSGSALTREALEKLFVLTVNGYAYYDKASNEILRAHDFGLFFTEFYLKKCTSLLTGNNLFLQIEIGYSPEFNIKSLQNGSFINLVEFEFILNPYLRIGPNDYSKSDLFLKKLIYMNDKDGSSNVFTYDEFARDIDVAENLLPYDAHKPKGVVSDDSSGNSRGSGNPFLRSSPPEERKSEENSKKKNLELTKDQTIFCILMVKILPENKYTQMKESIINLLSEPVNSRALEGFKYNDNKLINKELIEILGESYNNPYTNIKRRTNHFGYRINKSDIHSIEKIILDGHKLVQIAFHNFISIPLNMRKKIYSANQMFSLFEHRYHYLNGWDTQILFIKKIHPEDIIEKSFTVYSNDKSNNHFWFIICCGIISLFIIIVCFIFYKYIFQKKFNFSLLFKKRKTKKHKYSTFTTRYKYHKHNSKFAKYSKEKIQHVDKEELRHLIRRKTKFSAKHHRRSKKKNTATHNEMSKKKDHPPSRDYFLEEITPNYEFK